MSGRHRGWVGGAAAMFALIFFQRGLGLITTTVLARLFNAGGLGAYAFTQSVAQSLGGWARLGLDAGTHVVLAGTADTDRVRTEAVVGQALTLTMMVALVAGAGIAMSASVIATRMFGAPSLVIFVYPAALLFVAQIGSQGLYAIFAGLGAFPQYARTVMLGSLGSLVFSLIGAGALGPLGAAWGFAFAQITLFALLTARMIRVLGTREVRLRLMLPGPAVKEVFKIGLPFYAGTLLTLPADFSALALLGRVGGVEALGELRVSQAMMTAASALPAALAAPLITHLSARHAVGEVTQATVLQTKAVWSLALLIALGLMIVWPLAIELIFGADFPLARSVGELAIASFVPMMILTVLQGALFARGQAAFMFGLGVVHASAIVLGTQLLIPRYGLVGYFSAQGFSYGVVAIATAIAFARAVRPPSWVLALVLLTLALGGALAADIAYDFEIAERMIVGAVGVGVTLFTAARWVLSASERLRVLEAVAQVSASFGTALNSKFK